MKARVALAAALAGLLGLWLAVPASAVSFGMGAGSGGRMGGMGGFRGGMGGFGGGVSRSMGAPSFRSPSPTFRMGAPPAGRVGTFGGDRAFGGQFGVGDRGFRARSFGDQNRFFGRRRFDNDRDDFFFRHRRFRDDDDFSLGLIFGFGYPFYGYPAYPSYSYPAYPSSYTNPALLSYVGASWVGVDDLLVGWNGPVAGVRQVGFTLLDANQRVIGTLTARRPPLAVTFRDVPIGAAYLQVTVVHFDGSVESAVEALP